MPKPFPDTKAHDKMMAGLKKPLPLCGACGRRFCRCAEVNLPHSGSEPDYRETEQAIDAFLGTLEDGEIHTSHVYPPIPDRRFDWLAWRGDYDLGVRQAFGATEAEAIAELLQMEEDNA
jgi:hypothetical protein